MWWIQGLLPKLVLTDHNKVSFSHLNLWTKKLKEEWDQTQAWNAIKHTQLEEEGCWRLIFLFFALEVYKWLMIIY